MISVAEAQAEIDRRVWTLADEATSLHQIHGRVLREQITADDDLPPFDRSAMDGYAVRRDEDEDAFEVVGEIRAGQAIDWELQPGQALRIFTGARMPGPNLRVLLQEHVESKGSRIRVVKKSPAIHVRFRGEDARAGEVLLGPGTVVDATAAALLATLGRTSVRVTKMPRILHLTTGDEIVPPEQTPEPGQIRNSNASLIAALCREQGVETITQIHAGDNLPAMQARLTEAKVESFDLVLISGGSGAGSYDFSGELLRQLGATIHFREINVRPGKPLIFGTTRSQIIFGLPGNALSHFVCFHLFVRRALNRLLSRAVVDLTQAILVETMRDTSNARETWWPAQVRLREGRVECMALPWQSSGDITRLPAAQALIRVAASTAELTAGTRVELLFTRDWLP